MEQREKKETGRIHHEGVEVNLLLVFLVVWCPPPQRLMAHVVVMMGLAVETLESSVLHITDTKQAVVRYTLTPFFTIYLA